MSSLQLASRASRNGIARRMEAVARDLRRRGRPNVAAVIHGAAAGIRAGNPISAMDYAMHGLIDEMEVNGDRDWFVSQWQRWRGGATAAVVGGAASGVATLVQDSGNKRVRSSDLPMEQRYKKLKLVPVMTAQDETMEDVLNREVATGQATLQIPSLKTLARRQVAKNKRAAWLVRHTRKARAKALQSRFIPARLLLARLRRRRFLRRWIRLRKKKNRRSF